MWTLISGLFILWIHLSVLTPVPRCLDYCSFVISFKIRKWALQPCSSFLRLFDSSKRHVLHHKRMLGGRVPGSKDLAFPPFPVCHLQYWLHPRPWLAFLIWGRFSGDIQTGSLVSLEHQGASPPPPCCPAAAVHSEQASVLVKKDFSQECHR